MLERTLKASPLLVSSIHDEIKSFPFGDGPIILLYVKFHIAVRTSIMNQCDEAIEFDNSFVISAPRMTNGVRDDLLPVVDCDLIRQSGGTLFAFMIGPLRSMTSLRPNVYAIGTADTSW